MDRQQEAYEDYQKLLQEFPDYPDKLAICRKLLPLAQKLKQEGRGREIRGRNQPSLPASATPLPENLAAYSANKVASRVSLDDAASEPIWIYKPALLP